MYVQLVSSFMQKNAELDAKDKGKAFSGVDMVKLFPDCWVVAIGRLGSGTYGDAL